MRALAALALAALAASCAEPPPEEEFPEMKPPAPAFDREIILDRMAEIISYQVARRDTKHPVFHGCIDWHSAVHGHWAILRIARVTGRHADKAAAVAGNLDPEKIKREADFLREKPEFERPYGRAWFLLLAEEFERWSTEGGGEDPKLLHAMADEVAGSLLSFYAENPPSPDTPEYENASWALLRLHNWFEFAGDDASRKSVRKLVADNFLAADGPTFARDATAREFFSRYGNQAVLVARTQDAPTFAAWFRAHPSDAADLAPIVRLSSNAHHLGTNWSRAWAMKALAAATGENRFETAFEEHVIEAMRHHQLNKGDVWAYDHWVPQFAVYALTE